MPEKVEVEKCEHCGSRMTGRWESLSPGLCRTLVKFYQKARRLTARQISPAAHLQNDCEFTKNEYANFQKLRYFQLVIKTPDAGVWALTGTGYEFVMNRMSIWKKVFVFRNEVQRYSDDRMYISDAMQSEPFWMKREDFVPVAMPEYQEQRLF